MLTKPFFSVVIPTYNRPDLLGQTLDSVFSQEFRGFEAIVVDDGSTDDLSSVARDCEGRANFLRQANAGPSAARNLGISQAAGEYVAFLDSDDLWFPWTLATYREVIEQHQRPAFVAGNPSLFREASELAGIQAAKVATLPFHDYLHSGDKWRWFGVSSFVIRRDALLECGGFASEMRYGEDADLALKLGPAPGFVQIVSPSTFAYRQGSSGQLTGEWKPQLPAIERLLTNERSGQYPGGSNRATERHRIISRHVRPLALTLLRKREFSAAWRLYSQILPWNVFLGKWKFIMGFPALAAWLQSRALITKAPAH